VLVLGGSVAAGFAKDARRPLERTLETDPRWNGARVRVLGHGRGGFRQPQQLHLLEYLLEVGYRPEVVIELDGFNEVALGLQNARAGVHPVMPSSSHWAHLANQAPLTGAQIDQLAQGRRAELEARAVLANAERFGLFHSALATLWVDGRLRGCSARFAAADAAYRESLERLQARSFCIGPSFDPADEAVLELCADVWAQTSLDMDALCRRRGIRYLHVLQPTLHDEGSKPLTEDERAIGGEPAVWALGARLGYPKLRARVPQLIAAGVEVLDATRAFEGVSETLYYDVCHFAPAGNRMLGETVAELLLARSAPKLAAAPR
jgi:hypothetical protein